MSHPVHVLAIGQKELMDKLTREQRSWNMSRVRSRDTKPERTVRSLLHRMGYRFRLQTSRLPGKPDIILPKYRTVILVHGCFWHRHPGCIRSTTPKTNSEFWQQKFKENVLRDGRYIKKIEEAGWRAITVWQCELDDFDSLCARLQSELEDAKCLGVSSR